MHRAGQDGSGDEPWVEVARFGTPAEAGEHALVLTAVGISSRVEPAGARVALSVAASVAMRARAELAAYARENRRPPRPPAVSGRPFADGIDAMLAVWAVVVFLFAAARRDLFGLDWLAAGAIRADRIAGGEIWRALTALGLHVDVDHIAMNLAAGGAFGLLLAQLLGGGVAWLAILLAGGIGNLANALAGPGTHAAIGASTSVFGALGLLVALACARRISLRERAVRRWLPLGAGIMLIAFMGVGGERTDVGAHFAGFLAGLALGAAIARAGDRMPTGPMVQRTAAVACVCLFALAWLVALLQAA